jgi:phosphodiesterase/alkaline phosphatase D-like protein
VTTRSLTRAEFLGLIAAAVVPVHASTVDVQLPLLPKSLRFAVIGDSGTGERPQFQIGELMSQYLAKFPFDFVLMLGDNIYGSKTASGFRKKFEEPYKGLLDANVKFYAALGNHDHSDEIYYKPFNMNGKRYYNFHAGNADFFALDSDYMDPAQVDWLQHQLSATTAAWKICFFHHPLYSHARFHGEDVDLRSRLEPIFQKYGVNAVLTGHQHVYERLKPQGGINYIVLGNSGQLRPHDLMPSPETAKGFDTDQTFMLVEIADKTFHFQTISRANQTVDRGQFEIASSNAK